MEHEGPLLETLTRRLAECPAEFLAEPRIGSTGVVDVAAVVSDLLCDLGGALLDAQSAPVFRPAGQHKKHRNRLRTVLVASWLLHDPWFREHRRFALAVQDLLTEGLNELAELVQAPQLMSDADRREELVRLCLKALGLRPAGETAAQAEDRLTTLNSAERQRVIREAQAAEQRARAIREAMARKAAEEAAAKYMRE
jgi:hypothetical protein